MISVHLDRVTVRYTSDPIFSELSWEIHNDRTVGLIGPNGCGKSSLLKLITGQVPSDTGFINLSKDLKIGVLHQDPVLNSENTVFEETMLASKDILEIESELEKIEGKLGDPAVYGDEKALVQVLDRQEQLLASYDLLGGANYSGRVRSTLFELGFTESDLDLPTSVLSGGQKKLIEFAKLVITQPDLLLLDEPDNHLDLTGKSNLEKYIRAFKGGVVIVSHDRYLLDLLADEIAELEDGRLIIFPGNYSEYAFEKQARLALQQQRYQDQQKEITRLENSAKRLLLWGHVHDNEKFIKRGKNILKRIERIDKIERPVLERKKMGLELSGWRGSNKVLELENLSKSFDGSVDTPPLIKNANMLLWHGERVGLVGPNGAGKSVLFRMILDHFSPDTGEIKIGPSIKLGYYAQEHDTLEFDRTLLETVRRAAPLSENAAVSFLGRFLFSYRKVRENIENLSGGEKSRLQIALLMLTGANFLLLDEPTNNLDIQSAEVLEEAISEFEGSVFVISHDRYFLDQVVDRIVELDQGTLTEYQGGYGEYMAAKA